LNNRKIKSLLRKYRQGTTSKQENDALAQWLDRVKNEDPTHFNEVDIQQQLSKVKNKLNSHINQPVIVFRQKAFRLATAAVLLIISGLTITLWFSLQTPSNKKQYVKQPVERRISNGWVYLQTKKGIRQTVKLSDGSVIVINASSRLRYPQKFTGHKRTVYLDEGEALFTVAKDKTSPFTVYTAKFSTTALGTAFNIRSYQKEHRVSISLIHGKVAVHDLLATRKETADRILLPHHQIVADFSSIKSSSFDDETPITGWKDGVLSFKDASMAEVLNAIENRFGVSIINNSHDMQWSYTGLFKNEPVEQVLKTICLTEGINYSITDNEITLY
jgi:transmembrane sensor